MAIFSSAVIIIGAEPLKQLDRMSYDLTIRGQGSLPPNNSVIIVDIDEESLSRFGQWPWPRHLVARLFHAVRDGKPQSVGVDILFPEPDRTSLGLVSEKLEGDFGVDLDITSLPSDVVDNDLALSRALHRDSFFLGMMFRFGTSLKAAVALPEPMPRVIQVNRQGSGASSLAVADNVIAPIRLLAEAADGLGFVNVVPDQDGVIRKAPLLIEYDGTIYPSLALATYMRFKKWDEVILESGPNGITALRAVNTTIPVDRYGNVVIRFRGPSLTYHSISAAKIMEGEISPNIFHQKIVLVGSSAEGLKDTHPIPFDRRYPGVEVHASVIGTLLDSDFIIIPSWGLGAQGVGLFLTILLALVVVVRFPAWAAGGVFIGILFIMPFGSIILFKSRQIFISPISSMVLYVVSFSLLALIRFRSEEIRTVRYERQLVAAQDSAIVGLASLVETRDSETGNHILRTQKYVGILAQYLAKYKSEKFMLRPEEVDLLYKSSALHDVGKVGVPDNILLKPGPLTPSEFDEVKKHTLYGAEALSRADHVAQESGEPSFLQMAQEIALTHHERWDGTGYPRGLKGEEIPLSGRLMAVADVYDALLMRRVYKKAMTHEEATAIILASRGTHFDPEIVAAFEFLKNDFEAIAREYTDVDG